MEKGVRFVLKMALAKSRRLGLDVLSAGRIVFVAVRPAAWVELVKRWAANEKLLDSARRGDVHGVQTALGAGAGVAAKDYRGRTAAMVAAFLGQTACLGLLIEAGADVDAKSDDGWTAAIWAAYHGQGECLGLLMGAGADLEATNRYGETAAMHAASRGYSGIASLIEGALLSRKEAADLNMDMDMDMDMDMASGMAVAVPRAKRGRGGLRV